MSVKDIRHKKEFEVIQSEYLRCRSLYERLLIVNYRIDNSGEDQAKVAAEYQAIEKDAFSMQKKADAMVVATNYEEFRSMVSTWLNEVYQYCDDSVKGYTSGNTEMIQTSLQENEKIEQDFVTITENITSLGSGLKGVDLTEIQNWPGPENYAKQKIEKGK